ncbi:MAG TPA: hypothetical protein DHW79_04075, partial [Candidatus Cloacimonas sp.]|nr:hypothetical protein [Candidatus Cloacimonas sp.]
GFIETPYRKVSDGVVSDEYVYMDAAEEEKYIIAQSDVHLDDNRRITDEMIFARERGEFIQVSPNEI